jgi:RimJ/RimL family protein N-acetyltransferase
MLIRPARREDIPLIAAWTENTFDWGDYVAGRLPEWIENPASQVIVAEEDGAIVGTVTGTMVSPTETWAQGIRVHPEHRRKGIATSISAVLWDWAREQGARVIRLAVDDSNTSSQAQVVTMGFRKLADWRRGWRVIGEGSPVPEGNGGRRVPPPERLDVAPSAEAEPAFLSWSTANSPAPRMVYPDRMVAPMTAQHLVLPATGPLRGTSGLGVAEVDRDDNMLAVHWMETMRDDAGAMALALVDLAADAAVGEIRTFQPPLGWLETAFTRLGFEFHTVGGAMELDTVPVPSPRAR